VAYADYLRLGPDRSLERLATEYRARTDGVPTHQLSRLKQWSTTYGWQSRLQVIADAEVREAETREAVHRREIMESGYALVWERVRALKELADRLFAELQDPSRRWVREAKVVGSGKNAREVVVERFNSAEVEQLRGVLADIAKETGGRKDIQVVTGDADSPLEVRHGYDLNLSRLTDAELDQMERLVEKIGTDGRVWLWASVRMYDGPARSDDEDARATPLLW